MGILKLYACCIAFGQILKEMSSSSSSKFMYTSILALSTAHETTLPLYMEGLNIYEKLNVILILLGLIWMQL